MLFLHIWGCCLTQGPVEWNNASVINNDAVSRSATTVVAVEIIYELSIMAPFSLRPIAPTGLIFHES